MSTKSNDTAPEFSDAEFMSAAQKRKVLVAWTRFLESDFADGKFTKALYEHLHLRCGFIAYSNLRGFWLYYFDTGCETRALTFISQFDRQTGGKSAESWGRYSWWVGDYLDINYAMCEVMACHADRLAESLAERIKAREVAEMQRLAAKHGLKVEGLT